MICWSGGCDSTLMLANLAREAGDYGVRTVSFSHSGIPASQDLVKRRELILKELRGRGYTIEHKEISVEISGQFDKDGTFQGLAQPLIWIQALNYLQSNESFHMGYVRGDDVWHYRDDLFKLFNAAQRMGGRTGSLMLSLEWVSKADVIKQLKIDRLYKLCFYCEAPKNGKPCGKCHPCRTHKKALVELKM